MELRRKLVQEARADAGLRLPQRVEAARDVRVEVVCVVVERGCRRHRCGGRGAGGARAHRTRGGARDEPADPSRGSRRESADS